MYTVYVDPTRFVDDPVQVYLREICAVPSLTTDEETELSQHVLANDQQAESASMRLIEANLALVVSIAERYRDQGMHVLDLVQKGNERLLLARKRFADEPNTSFSVHAESCVDAALAKAIAESRPAQE